MLASTHKAIIEGAQEMSYGLLAERYGMTRSQVAGIVWRAKNPASTRIYKSPGKKRCGGKCGRGYGRGAYPRFTKQNSSW